MRATWLIPAVSLAVVASTLAATGSTAAPQRTGATITVPSEDEFLEANRKVPDIVQTESGLQYRIIKVGTGPHPTDTDVALLNYRGSLLSGAVFDNSTQPVPMGVKDVIPGFAEALKLMNKGAKLRVWIPSRLAYGDEEKSDQSGNVVIPASSLLVFDIEMLDFLPQTVIDRYQKQMKARKPLPKPRPGTPVRRKRGK